MCKPDAGPRRVSIFLFFIFTNKEEMQKAVARIQPRYSAAETPLFLKENEERWSQARNRRLQAQDEERERERSCPFIAGAPQKRRESAAQNGIWPHVTWLGFVLGVIQCQPPSARRSCSEIAHGWNCPLACLACGGAS